MLYEGNWVVFFSVGELVDLEKKRWKKINLRIVIKYFDIGVKLGILEFYKGRCLSIFSFGC